MEKKENYVIYFESNENEGNTGYFQRMDKIGFLSTKFKEQAKIFKTRNSVENKIRQLADKEGKWYNFKILKSM